MKQIWIITKRELKGYFDSLMAYILIVVFLGLSGFFTWLYGNNDVFFINRATMQPLNPDFVLKVAAFFCPEAHAPSGQDVGRLGIRNVAYDTW